MILRLCHAVLTLLLFGALAAVSVAGVPHLMTYQGTLAKDGTLFDGDADFKFAIVDLGTSPETTLWSNDGSSSEGAEPTSAVTIAVDQGLFTILLGKSPMESIQAEDLSGSSAVVLRTWVDTGDGSDLLSDQVLSSVAYAFRARSAERSFGGFLADGVIESTTGGFRFPDGTLQESAASSGGSSWDLQGNAGTDPGTDFVGTTDSVPLNFRVDSRRALRISPAGGEGSGSPNLIGGHSTNNIQDGAYSATIGGGGEFGTENVVFDHFGTIGGGRGNQVGSDDGDPESGEHATVGGGEQNIAMWTGATVAGGSDNSAVLGGATVGGGHSNQANGNYSSVLGGNGNEASSFGSAVGGGASNVASGSYAVVPGGQGNKATANYSFAAGHNAVANDDGAFVWADNSSTDLFYDGGPNSFKVRANLGVKIADSTGTTQISLNPRTGIVRTPILEIVGGSDIAEPFSSTDGELEPGTVVVIDPNRPGAVRSSASSYDRTVVGVVSGAGGIEPGLTLRQDGVTELGPHVALTGRVYVKAVAQDGPIEPGDLLTTSPVSGHAMAAANPEQRQGAVLGKALTGLKTGTGLVLALVTLQ